MKLAANPGMLVLGIWLILYGAIPLLKINLDVGPVMHLLAIAAGALILMNK
jgi:hypothetical protein